MRLFLFDMGAEKYGDAVLVVEAEKTILIDGAHPRDIARRSELTPSLPDQLGAALGARPPYRVSLLVVTHCHADHIGCLPAMVEAGTLAADWALVADEGLGYPPDDDDGQDAAADPLLAALREEPRGGFASRDELDQFLTDAATIEQRYRAMLATLAERGTRLVRYTGLDDPALHELEAAFADTGLKVLGPTQDHLLLCTDAIARFNREARDAVALARETVPGLDADTLPALLLARGDARLDALPGAVRDFLDRPGKGAALNDQSIVLRIGAGADTVLLTGDMQLAKPEVRDLDGLMTALLATIRAAGPYAFAKIGHHASYNAFDDEVLAALGGTAALGVTTGRGDPGHPDSGVLALLRAGEGRLRWARTDRNGMVEVLIEDGQARMVPERGRLNDAGLNVRDEALPVEPVPAAEPAVRITPARSSTDVVEIEARIPHVATRVTITVEVEPRAAAAPSPAEPPRQPRPEPPPPRPDDRRRLGGGRQLPPLLFATAVPRLEANIGREEARRALALIEAAGQPVLDVARPEDPFAEVGAALKDMAGVVLLGGYDVVPARRYDTVPPELRRRLGPHSDPDDFVVWSDQAYGDRDGDGLGEIPVSRIPDGRSAELVLAALTACPGRARGGRRFGLRNAARPFADAIFEELLAGEEPILASAPTGTADLPPHALDAHAVYLMLHGLDSDTSRFWGETADGETLEALDAGTVPDPCGATVLAGCCWGALTARTRAARWRPGHPVQSLTPELSLALTFLRQGAWAFVGCTGAHYSPVAGEEEPEESLDYFGGPLHRAFWTRIRAGEAPAPALFGAKLDYMKGMPHGRRSLEEQAIEYKLLRQFTCLGLGW